METLSFKHLRKYNLVMSLHCIFFTTQRSLNKRKQESCQMLGKYLLLQNHNLKGTLGEIPQ